jgi:PhoH-like ATPase
MKDNILGVRPLDLEQVLALRELLMNDEISLCVVTGRQGCGKTLLTYAAMVHQIMDHSQKTPFHSHLLSSKTKAHYRKIVLYKPISLVGGKKNDVGFLPGSLFQKIRPYLQGYIDCHNDNTELGKVLTFEDMFRHPTLPDTDFPKTRQYKGTIDGGKLPTCNSAIELRYIGHARGNTLTNTIISIDEAQNFTPFEIKTIMERAGPGSKVIITGDPLQVDNPSITSTDINGLTSAIRHYLGKPYFGMIRMNRNYRHQISDDSEGWNAPN